MQQINPKGLHHTTVGDTSSEGKRVLFFPLPALLRLGESLGNYDCGLTPPYKKNTRADAWAPQIADQYLLDNVLAAEGIARSILREEIGAAWGNVFSVYLL
jgi:hypothetical protein